MSVVGGFLGTFLVLEDWVARDVEEETVPHFLFSRLYPHLATLFEELCSDFGVFKFIALCFPH